MGVQFVYSQDWNTSLSILYSTENSEVGKSGGQNSGLLLKIKMLILMTGNKRIEKTKDFNFIFTNRSCFPKNIVEATFRQVN